MGRVKVIEAHNTAQRRQCPFILFIASRLARGHDLLVDRRRSLVVGRRLDGKDCYACYAVKGARITLEGGGEEKRKTEIKVALALTPIQACAWG